MPYSPRVRLPQVCKRLALTMAVVLTACHPQNVRPPQSRPASPPPKAEPRGATRYMVDSAASTLHILVYRGGALASLGHNHVIDSHQVTGEIDLAKPLARSRVMLKLPVAGLVVDDPQARKDEGSDFAAAVPDDAREGTRKNLLRPEVLDVEHFPSIALESVSISGDVGHPHLLMRITIKGKSRDVPVNANVEVGADRLTARGEFSIRQTDFGMTPFSVALGALKVQDAVRIKFTIVGVH